MRTPCQEAPEAWVGEDAKLRAEAAKECLTCPVFDACRDGKFGRPGPEDSGVWAGVEYVNGRPLHVVRANLKRCPTCGTGATRDDTKFCSRECYWNHAAVQSGLPREKTCEICQGSFSRGDWSRTKWRAARFCSRQCAGKARRKNRDAA